MTTGRPRAPVAGLVCLLVVAACMAQVTKGTTFSFVVLLTAVSVWCVGAWLHGSRRWGSFLSPPCLAAVAVAALYVARPAYDLSHGTFDSGAFVDTRTFDAGTLAFATSALELVVLCLAAASVSWMLFAPATGLGGERPNWTVRIDNPRWLPRVRLLLVTCGVVVLAVFAVLISHAGGLHPYLDQLANRSELFSGKGFLVDVVVPLNAALLLGLAYAGLDRDALRRHWFMWVVAFAVLCVGDVLAGSRGDLLIGTLVPVGIVLDSTRPVNFRRVAVVGLVGLLVFVALRVELRQDVFAAEGSAAARANTSVAGELLGQNDIVAFDSLIILEQGHADGQGWQLGRTYTPVTTWIVPRSLWAGKPLGGGNAWFTQTYLPSYYGPDHVESSISFIGEAYANFGPLGALVLTALVTAAVARFYRWYLRRRPEPLPVAIFATCLGEIIVWLRGDAYHSLTNMGIFVLIAWVLNRLLSARVTVVRAEGAPGHTEAAELQGAVPGR